MSEGGILNLEIVTDRKGVNRNKIQTSGVFLHISKAFKEGYATATAQGSARSSKTFNIILWLILACLQRPNTSVSVVRLTRPSIKKSVLKDFLFLMARLGIYNPRAFNKTELAYTFDNGSTVEMFGADSEQKIRGSKRDILFINEANELAEEAYLQLKIRTAMFEILDFNPSISEEHWIVKLNQEKKTYHFITTYKQNPFLEQSIYDAIESMKDKNPSWYRVFGLGQRGMVEGLVYPTFSTVAYFPEFAERVMLALDFGFQNDPTAVLRCGFIPPNNLYVEELVYQKELMGGEIARLISRYKTLPTIADSADPRLIKEIRNAGFRIEPVVKGAGSIEAGISKIREMNIFVVDGSENVRRELRNYTYRFKDGQWLNVPIDAFNHAMDAMRYYTLTAILGKRTKKRRLSGYFGIPR